MALSREEEAVIALEIGRSVRLHLGMLSATCAKLFGEHLRVTVHQLGLVCAHNELVAATCTMMDRDLHAEAIRSMFSDLRLAIDRSELEMIAAEAKDLARAEPIANKVAGEIFERMVKGKAL